MKKILLIEDDKNIRENISMLLRLNEYEVHEISSGENAVEEARELNPDLIISDILLPVKDGFRIKEELGQDESMVHVPFLFLSAKTDLADIRKGMNLGADDYLTKPVKSRDLLDAIETRLNRFQDLKAGPGESRKQLDEHDRILISPAGKPILIELGSIVYIAAEGEYSTVFMDDHHKYFLRKLLKSWEEELPQKDFIRIHRSSIVNMKFVDSINKIDHRNYEISLKIYDNVLPISQRYAVKIKRRLGV